jgi:hypothetical protein
MPQLWILMDNFSSYPQTPQLLGQRCRVAHIPTASATADFNTFKKLRNKEF